MKFNFEINVGLHRGGYDEPEQIASSLLKLRQSNAKFSVSGLMGYEPHLTGQRASLKDQSVQDVLGIYYLFSLLPITRPWK